MKRFLGITVGILILGAILYFAFLNYANYSEGIRSGELIKFSQKGIFFKTYEGEISQGLSGSKIFAFSVLDKDSEVISAMKELDGQYVKVTYKERYKTFPWWGDTKYFIVEIKKADSPYKLK
jgi:hypothetical protein